MAEEKQLSMAEVRKTIATSLGAAFGFIIALTWNSVVLGGLAVGGIQLGTSVPQGDYGAWAYGVVTAVVLTIVMILMIIFVGRWGSK
jgi:uncharacterized membrane protein